MIDNDRYLFNELGPRLRKFAGDLDGHQSGVLGAIRRCDLNGLVILADRSITEELILEL